MNDAISVFSGFSIDLAHLKKYPILFDLVAFLICFSPFFQSYSLLLHCVGGRFIFLFSFPFIRESHYSLIIFFTFFFLSFSHLCFGFDSF